MKVKGIITAFFLLFVLVSVVYLIIDESTQQVNVVRNVGEEGGGAPQHKVIAYYFHGNMRCQTCRKIEAYANEAVRIGFPEELKAGTLEWRVVNIDEPANKHFVEEYELITRSLVIVDFRDGRQTAWKNLERVWDLVGNKTAFLNYVQEETRLFLAGDG